MVGDMSVPAVTVMWHQSMVRGTRMCSTMCCIRSGGGAVKWLTVSATAKAYGSTNAFATAYGDDAYGIEMSEIDGTLTNMGEISGTINATAFASATDGDASALIKTATEAFGIEMSHINSGGLLDNSGTISATINAYVKATATVGVTASASASINEASQTIRLPSTWPRRSCSRAL